MKTLKTNSVNRNFNDFLVRSESVNSSWTE